MEAALGARQWTGRTRRQAIVGNRPADSNFETIITWFGLWRTAVSTASGRLYPEQITGRHFTLNFRR